MKELISRSEKDFCVSIRIIVPLDFCSIFKDLTLYLTTSNSINSLRLSKVNPGIATLRKISKKSSAGYNLTNLFIGSDL